MVKEQTNGSRDRIEGPPNSYDGEETASSTNVALETGYLHAQIEIRSMSFTLYKYQLKMD
jgi:hypothetical protein